MTARAPSSFTELAIVSRITATTPTLHVNRPYAPNKKVFDEYVNGAWERRWFSNDGPIALELEHKLKLDLGVSECVLMANGTVAMSALILASGLAGEVILPAFTFVSTAHALQMAGIKPVFCDVDVETGMLDVEHCRNLVSKETSAVIATHLWGEVCAVHRLQTLCNETGIKLFFDAAHAFYTEFEGNKVGGLGDAEVFSFHSTKVFHTFEGGAVTTNNPELAARLRSIRNFGFVGYDKVDRVGMNAKLNEVSAAAGLAGLVDIDQRIKRCRSVFNQYAEGLDGIEGLCFYPHGTSATSNHHYVVMMVDDRFGLTRDQLIECLWAENILVRKYFYPGVDQMLPYREQQHARLPNTRELCKRVLILPSGADIGDDEIARVVATIRLIAVHTKALSNQFTAEHSS